MTKYPASCIGRKSPFWWLGNVGNEATSNRRNPSPGEEEQHVYTTDHPAHGIPDEQPACDRIGPDLPARSGRRRAATSGATSSEARGAERLQRSAARGAARLAGNQENT